MRFFCLGITSAGLSEADYTRITYNVTMAAANVLARLNAAMTFVFVSGAGTDTTAAYRMLYSLTAPLLPLLLRLFPNQISDDGGDGAGDG